MAISVCLKYLRASCCSDERSSVPAGNGSEPRKTEVLGKKVISLSGEKNVFPTSRTMSWYFGRDTMGSWGPEKIC